MTLKGCGRASANYGVGLCASYEFHNPFDKEFRDEFLKPLTSKKPKKVIKGLVKGGLKAASMIINPTKVASKVLGWKPKNKTEKIISHIPGINIGAAIGRSWGFWQLQDLNKILNENDINVYDLQGLNLKSLD